MSFNLLNYNEPNFEKQMFKSAPNVVVECVELKGVAPENYHATTIFPEYFKIDGKWVLAKQSRMDCVAVLKYNNMGSLNEIEIKEFRKLEPGDKVILGRAEDGSEGIYVHTLGFSSSIDSIDSFAFRQGKSRETSYSRDYDKLYELLRYEKDNGYILWVLGPAVVFDADSRKAMSALIENGYADAILTGNAVATHDLEASIFHTALGQDIYTKKSLPRGHYNHIDVINKTRKAGSFANLIQEENIKDGIIYACVKNKIKLVLAGSIRDDGPMPSVISDAYAAQDSMRECTKKATTVLMLATQLHSIATGNMTPSYQVIEGKVRPVYIYTIDISEFAANKLRDRGSLEVNSIITNVQDFLVHLERNLIR
jgi:lysine-ketoglutarate reductase/saccharopine dehydrogenase-like protein (TIGR00300 family)